MEDKISVYGRDKELYYLFKDAIKAEQQAQKTYKKALEYCTRPVVCEMLQTIHDEEVKHEEKLRQVYNELRQHFDMDGDPKEENEQ